MPSERVVNCTVDKRYMYVVPGRCRVRYTGYGTVGVLLLFFEIVSCFNDLFFFIFFYWLAFLKPSWLFLVVALYTPTIRMPGSWVAHSWPVRGLKTASASAAVAVVVPSSWRLALFL